MAVTLNQMAEAYIGSVRSQLEQAKEQAQQAQAIVVQIEQHLQECLTEASNKPESQVVVSEEGTTTTALPNPFEQS
jgi:hypothetical protein